MTFEEALKEMRVRFEESGIDDPETDAWVLLEFVTGMDRAHFFLDRKEQVKQDDVMRLEELTAVRCQRVPLQQVTGFQYFYGRRFEVNEHVLIPRQDTECLVEEALKKIKNDHRVLDLCTGSGCIAITIAKESGSNVCASDISQEALKVAKRNAHVLDAAVSFYEGNLLEPVEGTFDVIVSNPPYIESSEIPNLMPEVKDHEPMSALDGTEDGLFFYREISAKAGDYLRTGGWLLFEIGYNQGKSVPDIMKKAGFRNIEVKKDLAGCDRVVLGQKQEEICLIN